MNNLNRHNDIFSIEHQAFAFTWTYRTYFLCLEPLAYTSCMSSMLAGLAPKKPHVDVVIRIFSWLVSLHLSVLQAEELFHRVKDCHWLQAHWTAGDLLLAFETAVKEHLLVVLGIDQLPSNCFDLDFDRHVLVAPGTPRWVLKWSCLEWVCKDYLISSFVFCLNLILCLFAWMDEILSLHGLSRIIKDYHGFVLF